MSDPPEAALGWCIGNVPGARRVRTVTRLRGGIAALTHAVELAGDDEQRFEVVLRRFAGEVSEHWPPVEGEAAVLQMLQACELALRTPKLLASDPTGAGCGLPALLLDRLPGAIDVSPRNLELRVSQLARALAAFHRAAPAAPAGARRFAIDFARRTRTATGSAPPDWPRAWALLETLDLELHHGQLIHGDFHIGNALFEDARLCGIVDWSLAHSGPWQFDVGYCRVDLSLVFSLEAADLFLAEYEAARELAVPCIALWDLAGASRAYPDPAAWLPGWLDAGRSDLTPDLVRERLARFVTRALARV